MDDFFGFLLMACGPLATILADDLVKAEVSEEDYFALARRLECAELESVARQGRLGLPVFELQFLSDLVLFGEVLQKLNIGTFQVFWIAAASGVFASIGEALGEKAQAHRVAQKAAQFAQRPSAASFHMLMASFEGSLREAKCEELQALIKRLARLGDAVG